jgi:hypothetical protein
MTGYGNFCSQNENKEKIRKVRLNDVMRKEVIKV